MLYLTFKDHKESKSPKHSISAGRHDHVSVGEVKVEMNFMIIPFSQNGIEIFIAKYKQITRHSTRNHM